MKKFIFGLCIFLWFTSIVTANTLETKQQIRTFETSNNFHDGDMYLTYYFYDYLKLIWDVCPASDIESAKGYVEMMKNNLWSKYGKMSTAKQLKATFDMYAHLMRVHPRLDVLPAEYYCILKYTIAGIQERLRDLHIWHMETTGIIKDFDWFTVSGPIHGFDIKNELLDEHIHALSMYENSFWDEMRLVKRNDFRSENDQRSTIAQKSERIMVLSVYKALSKLIEKWLLDSEDISQLSGKITLWMEASCSTFHGNYTVTETLNHHWEHISYNVDNLPVDVNVCGNYFMLQELPDFFYKIVVHELGHHFYYFHDRLGNQNFTNICRSGGANSCQQTDFVSNYAQTIGEEDYAEHFMHRFLDLDDDHSETIRRKSAHFEAFVK